MFENYMAVNCDIPTRAPVHPLLDLSEPVGQSDDMGGQGQRGQQALAEAVKARRLHLGLTQRQLADLGGPSIVTVRQVEKATGPVPSGLTLSGIDRALRWASGSAQRILDGGRPEEMPDVTPPQRRSTDITLEEAIENDTDLHPAARAHLLNQLQILRHVPRDAPIPSKEQEQRRDEAWVQAQGRAMLEAVPTELPARKRTAPRKVTKPER